VIPAQRSLSHIVDTTVRSTGMIVPSPQEGVQVKRFGQEAGRFPRRGRRQHRLDHHGNVHHASTQHRDRIDN
jgi:hypothetical protein